MPVAIHTDNGNRGRFSARTQQQGTYEYHRVGLRNKSGTLCAKIVHAAAFLPERESVACAMPLLDWLLAAAPKPSASFASTVHTVALHPACRLHRLQAMLD